MKGRITANQGESRYTVAVDANTALLQILIDEKQKLKDSVIQVLYGVDGSAGLYAQEREYEETYNAAMQVVTDLTTALNDERAEVTVQSCLTARLQACDDAKSAAEQACRDTAVACRNDCDGSLECLRACDDAEDACEAAADVEWQQCTAQANLDCVDFVTQRTAEIFAHYSPLIAAAQADTVEALAPLQATRSDIAYWEAQRLSIDRALTQYGEIEVRGIAITCWSAQYNTEIAVGTEVEVARTPSGRHVVTALGSDGDCLHDARAVPGFNLFVNSAMDPGVQTWRPTWRTGIVREKLGDNRLRVEVQGGEVTGSLGTRYSRRTIDCTPPAAYFGDGDIYDTGEARDAYEEALEAWQATLAARDACYAEFSVAACQATPYETCATNRSAALLDCLDVRALGIAACAGDPECIAYVEAQYQACVESVEATAVGCYQAADDQCALDRIVHIEACDTEHATAISDAEDALREAEQALRNAEASVEAPASPLLLDVPIAHCLEGNYRVGDDVLIDFPDRPISGEPSGTTGGAIRSAAMAVWNSARVVGWASSPRRCAYMLRSAYLEWDNNAKVMTLVIVEGMSDAFPQTEIFRTVVPMVRFPTDGTNPPPGITGPEDFFRGIFPYDWALWSESGETFAFIERPRLDNAWDGVWPSNRASLKDQISNSNTTTQPTASYSQELFGGRVFRLSLPPPLYSGELPAPGSLEIVAEYSVETSLELIGEFIRVAPVCGKRIVSPAPRYIHYSSLVIATSGEVVAGYRFSGETVEPASFEVDYSDSETRDIQTVHVDNTGTTSASYDFIFYPFERRTKTLSVDGNQIIAYSYDITWSWEYRYFSGGVKGHTITSEFSQSTVINHIASGYLPGCGKAYLDGGSTTGEIPSYNLMPDGTRFRLGAREDTDHPGTLVIESIEGRPAASLWADYPRWGVLLQSFREADPGFGGTFFDPGYYRWSPGYLLDVMQVNGAEQPGDCAARFARNLPGGPQMTLSGLGWIEPDGRDLE